MQGLKKNTSSGRTIFNIVMTTLATLCMVVTLIPLVLVLTLVLVRGIGRLDLALFTQLPPPPGLEGGGIANAIFGTLIIVAIATLISVPFGIMAAIYLSEFSEGSKLAKNIQFATNVLSGVPSIIAGVFVYALLVSSNLTGFSAVAGGVALAILMLPTIIRTTDEGLKIVPQEVRWASVGVGASNYQTVLKVVLPAATPAIITGITLAIARAAGETAPLIFTALFSQFWPNGIFNPIASLAVLVYNFAIVPFEPQQELAWAGAFILVLLVLTTSIAARWATRQRTY
ncbi:phosphate ABC transporter permease PstA [Halothece sp. PCC 7418]|uniref:phosphate ABC transporter permease PstA n=1 Tax=Halothece sp. (strain PCC 7418) TaxID=65093 RepID=UPI0005A0B22D|nr:phosphate ABC transporter permease PstA [Halothece sp. PCC 7418]